VDLLESRRLLATVAPGFATDVAYGGTINNGSAMDFSPDGRLWVVTQTGSVHVIQPNATTNTVAATLPVNSWFERGLLGIAFDPSFDSTAPGTDYVYLYYTELPTGQPPGYTGQTRNRVSRFEVTGNTINTGTETLLMRFDLLTAGNHNGGGIHFGHDGKLYVAIGENAVPSNAQSLANRHGKMLRLNPDPLDPIPADNPTSFAGIAGSPTGDNRAIWAVGLRNPYTFAFQPDVGRSGTPRLHINDVGQNSWEEINLGGAGLNYGWPQTEGNNPPGVANVTYPVYTYQNVGNQIAITGGTFYNPPFNQFGSAYTGDYFFADLGAGWIRRLDAASNYALQSTGGVGGGADFVQGASNVVDLKVDSVGSLFFLQRGGAQGVRIVRTINPQVADAQFRWTGNILPNPPHRVTFQFTHNVSASLQPSDLVVQNLDTSQFINPADMAVSYDAVTNTATFSFPGINSSILPDADYVATLQAAGVTDPEGDPLPANSVVNFFVKAGDADHNGVIDGDDYALIDMGFNLGLSGWENGDFDYNGVIDGDDYAIIDLAFNTQ
jgi:glucose/arabinose dehydrogenase